MKTIEAERLAQVILDSSRGREVIREAPPPQTKAQEEKLQQMRRQFDKKYSIHTPPELMKI